jgi:hypothetical protein
MRRTLSLLAKATISILLLYLSLQSIDVGTLGARLSEFESGWVALALFLLTVQAVLLAVRWRNISAACGANLPCTLALQISFIATFFNQVLRSTVGGDSMRIWLFARKGAGWASATYSVLIDRIAGDGMRELHRSYRDIVRTRGPALRLELRADLVQHSIERSDYVQDRTGRRMLDVLSERLSVVCARSR